MIQPFVTKANGRIRRKNHERNLTFKRKFKWDTVVHAYNLFPQEARARVASSRPIQAPWQDLKGEEGAQTTNHKNETKKK